MMRIFPHRTEMIERQQDSSFSTEASQTHPTLRKPGEGWGCVEPMASLVPQLKSRLVAVCGMLGSFKRFVFDRTAPDLSSTPNRCVNSCAATPVPRLLIFQIL